MSENKGSRKRVLITLGIVGIILIGLLGALVAGGAVGYFVGRREARRIARAQGWLLPQLLRPAPNVPEIIERLPNILRRPWGGAIVYWVEPDSAAAEAGIKAGDVITAVDDVKLDEDHSLAELISKYEVGDEVKLTMRRRGDEGIVTVTVKLGSRTTEEGKELPYLGISYSMISVPFFRTR